MQNSIAHRDLDTLPTIFNSRPSVEVIAIDYIDVMIVDDFLKEPDLLRQFALKVYENTSSTEQSDCKITPLRTGYEVHPRKEIFDQHFPEISARIQQLVATYIGGKVRQYFDVPPYTSTLNLGKGPYFNCLFGLPGLAPHVDQGHISTFLYLNPASQCWGGTAIYRHVPTDALTADQRRPVLSWMCQKPLAKPLTTSTDEWKLEECVEMKFNRLVAFNASAIHKVYWPDSKSPFTSDIKGSRLTLNNFYAYASDWP